MWPNILYFLISAQGPIAVYIAPASSNGSGPVWVKIYEEAYSNGSWAVDKLILAHGQHSVIIPPIPAGDYLFRGKLTFLIASTFFSNVACLSS